MLRDCSPPPNMSHVTCHVSRHVSRQMSHVTCHVSHITIIIIFFFAQSGEAYRWRVCYQRGLPRLVSSVSEIDVKFQGLNHR